MTESKQIYGTDAFDLDVMRKRIKSDNRTGNIELGSWVWSIPLVYQNEVSTMIENVKGYYIGKKSEPALVEAFILHLHKKIRENLTPRPFDASTKEVPAITFRIELPNDPYVGEHPEWVAGREHALEEAAKALRMMRESRDDPRSRHILKTAEKVVQDLFENPIK